MSKPGSKTAQLETAERRAFVLEKRRGGMKYRAIAAAAVEAFGQERLPGGWDERYAAKDVSRELEKLRAANEETADDVRQIEVDRLDAMLEGLWPMAKGGVPAAIQKVLNIMERRARLLGLDAPEEISQAVTVLESEDYQRFRAKVMQALEGFPEARAALASALGAEAEGEGQE